MPLSANTLIHFTNSKESLKSILLDNFKIFYCRETVDFAMDRVEFFVPMVSFCDIPLSEIKVHMTKYGRYGIGLTKEWGIRNRLNPVLYVSKGSHLAKSYQTAYLHFSRQSRENGRSQSEEHKSLVDTMRYIKNYEGVLSRLGQHTEDYRFSDEREWRYVPPSSEKCDMLIGGTVYKDERKNRAESLLTNLRLEFAPNDIKYVIINEDSEISEFIEHFRRAKGKKYVLDDIERLTTRILTAQQIEQDM